MPSKHAKLSASSAFRWINCPGSVVLADQLPAPGSSAYADEGTLAHALAELKLRKFLGDAGNYDKELAQIQASEYYCGEMDEATDFYAETVQEHLAAAGEDAELMIEQQFSLDNWVPEGFGTSDAVIIGGSTIEVIDLKYGKGVKVEAKNNPQLRLYGLGASALFGDLYDFETVRTTIIQPRLDHVSGEEIPLKELLLWAEEEVAPKARMAMDGTDYTACGDWCRWCPAKAVCRKRAEYNLELAKDYNTLIRRMVGQMTASGLRTDHAFSDGGNDYGIDYASGWHNRIDVAARRALLTGFGQLTGRVTDMNAQRLGTQYFEVTWHAGARPDHAVWQGKVYTKEQLTTKCGLGTGPGLLGWNCRHTYYPFIPGISERLYTDEWLAEQNAREANLATMQNFQPLTEEEEQIIQKVTEIIRSKETIACTGCRYCVDGCPQKIAIPDYFKLMNDIAKFGDSQVKRSKMNYNHFTDRLGMGKASACIQCGQCESHCPQHLPIINYLKDTANTLEP